MTAKEALEDVEARVQEMREEGELDLRSILHYIKSLRTKLKEDEADHRTAPDNL